MLSLAHIGDYAARFSVDLVVSYQIDVPHFPQSACLRQYFSHHTIPLSWVSSAIFGIEPMSSDPANSSESMYVRGFAPTRKLYSGSYGAWSSYVHNLASFAKGMEFSGLSDDVSHENSVRHTNLKGELVYTGSTVPYHPGLYDSNLPNTAASWRWSRFFKSSDPTSFTATITWHDEVWHSYGGFYIDQIKDLTDLGNYDYHPGPDISMYCTNPTIQLAGDYFFFGVTVITGQRVSILSNDWEWYATRLHLKMWATMHAIPVVDGVTYEASEFINLSYSVEKSISEPIIFDQSLVPNVRGAVLDAVPHGTEVFTDFVLQLNAISSHTVHLFAPIVKFQDDGVTAFLDRIGYSREKNCFVISNSRDFHSFNRFCKEFLPTVEGGSFFAAQDAFNTWRGIMSTNYVESVSEMRELGALFQPLVDVSKYLTTNYRGGLRNLLKILASSHLAVRFGYVNTHSDAVALSASAGKALRRLKVLDEWSAAYGTKVFKNLQTQHPDFPVVDVVFTCKVILRMLAEGMWLYLLTADQMTLLPRVSRVWAALSKTWFFDSFFKLSPGDSSKLVEDQLAMFLAEVDYSTFAVEVRYNFTDADLGQFGISRDTNASTPFKFLCFQRRVYNKFMPPLGMCPGLNLTGLTYEPRLTHGSYLALSTILK